MTGAIEHTGPQYPTTVLRRSHTPPVARPYQEYRDCLREEQFFTCGYCLSTEREVAPGLRYAGFEIDHFRPTGLRRFRRYRNYYPNLVWACRSCNQAKGDEWPSKEEEARGFRFVDPVREPMGAHLRIAGEHVEAVGGSPAALFTIRLLRLNSQLHVRRRKERAEMATQIALLEALIESQAAGIGDAALPDERAAILRRREEMAARLHEIRALVDRSTRPPDANGLCVCDPGWKPAG